MSSWSLSILCCLTVYTLPDHVESMGTYYITVYTIDLNGCISFPCKYFSFIHISKYVETCSVPAVSDILHIQPRSCLRIATTGYMHESGISSGISSGGRVT